MARTIIVDGGEKIACPKCNHGFGVRARYFAAPLTRGSEHALCERGVGFAHAPRLRSTAPHAGR